MARLATALVLLASALGASAQSSSSSVGSASSSPSSSGSSTATSSASAAASTASGNVTTTGQEQQETVTLVSTVAAQANSSQIPTNATLQGVWSVDESRGTLTQGMALLQNSTATAQNQSVLGVFLRYNESTALANANSSTTTTSLPWIALISCDSPTTQSLELPADTANSTLASFGNATTAVPVNGTDSANGTTTGSSPAQANFTASVFGQAEEQGARAIVLYSVQQQSCSLNYTALNMTNTSLPIWTTPSQNVAQTVVSQFNNIASDHRYFNASLLNASAGNLSSLLEANQNANATTLRLSSASYFVLARLAPFYNPNESNNGVVATIGRNPTATATQTQSAPATGTVGPAPTASDGAGNGGGGSSGASRSTAGLAMTGLVAGGLVAAAGLLL
ncbi:hypothetical protein JCM3775_004668 [Rhodotorula graminis]